MDRKAERAKRILSTIRKWSCNFIFCDKNNIKNSKKIPAKKKRKIVKIEKEQQTPSSDHYLFYFFHDIYYTFIRHRLRKTQGRLKKDKRTQIFLNNMYLLPSSR